MEPIRINIHQICVVKHAAKTSYLYDSRIHKDNILNIKLHTTCYHLLQKHTHTHTHTHHK